MFLLDFSSKQFCLQTLLWSRLLFKSAGITTELGVLGEPEVHVSTITLTTTIAYDPKLAPGSSETDHGASKSTDSSQSNDGHSKNTGDENKPTVVSLPPETSLSTSANAASALLKATGGSEPPMTSDDATVTKSAVSAPAIAAIVSSISGTIIVAAFLVLCFRAYKRRKQQENEIALATSKQHQPQQQEARFSMRPIPSAIDTTGHHESGFRKDNKHGSKLGQVRGKEGDNSDIQVTTNRVDFVPTTPALESGGRFHHSGLHSRFSTATSPSSDRDTLYNKLLEEVRAGPANPNSAASLCSSLPPPDTIAASSAVQWRGPPPETPSTASAALFDFDFKMKDPTPSPEAPAAAARPGATLGDRAWHRRKMSTTFQPPTSGPPSMPLPPPPPRRPTQASTSNPGQDRDKVGGDGDWPDLPPPPKGLYTLGGPSNLSSVSLESPGPTPPPKDSPRLPEQTQTISQSPAPEVAPGEQSDSRQLKKPVYAKKGGESDQSGSKGAGAKEEESTQMPGQEHGGNAREISPMSESTVDTDILFPSDVEDDERPLRK